MFYSNFLEKFILPAGDFLTNGSFLSALRKLREIQFLSSNELIDLQLEKLYALLQHVSKNSIYYKKLNVPFCSDPLVWLKRFPILEKQTLRLETDNMLTMPKEKLFKHCSSGSTGYQSIVYWSAMEQSIHRATQILWWEWAGYQIGDTLIQTGINPQRGLIKSVKDFIFKTDYIQAFSHSEADVVEVIKKYRDREGIVLAGYASSIFVIAKIAEKNEISSLRFKTAICWGDKLFSHYRKAIERTFNTQVYETYGSAEGLMMAAQGDLDHMYQMSPNTLIEIVDDEGNEVPDGEMGNVLVTNLNAFAMPLIRYKVGDLAVKMPKSEYPPIKKFGFPVLKKVIGRDTDLVKTRSGKYMVVHSFTGIFEHIPEIEQFCIVQKDLDNITIQFVPGESFKESLLESIKQKILEHLKENIEITFQQVKFIKSTPSGKPQIIVSQLTEH